MLKLFLWLRYLRKRKIVLLSIAAVALSAALLIVVASLFDGFIKAIEQVGREAFGDVYLNPWVQIEHSEKLIESLEELPQVESAAAVLDTYGLLHLGRGNVRAVRILGIDPPSYDGATGFKSSLLGQKDSRDAPSFAMDQYPEEKTGFVAIGVLGKADEKTDQYDFKQIKGAWLGKEVVLTTGAVIESERDDASGVQRRFKRKVFKFRIADIVFTGMYLRDTKDIYLPIAQVRELTGSHEAGRTGPHEVVQIKLADGVEQQKMIEPVRHVWEEFAQQHKLPSYAVSNVILKTSRQMQEDFVRELRKQMKVLMLIFGVVCSAVVLLIFCIFFMIVETRRKDVAVIKSCGAGSGSVASIFLGFGACVGLIGSVIGTILGYVITANVNTIEEWVRIVFGLKLWKSSVYAFEKIPNQVDWNAAMWVAIAAIIAATLGALVPAVVAARTKPVNILRYE